MILTRFPMQIPILMTQKLLTTIPILKVMKLLMILKEMMRMTMKQTIPTATRTNRLMSIIRVWKIVRNYQK